MQLSKYEDITKENIILIKQKSIKSKTLILNTNELKLKSIIQMVKEGH